MPVGKRVRIGVLCVAFLVWCSGTQARPVSLSFTDAGSGLSKPTYPVGALTSSQLLPLPPPPPDTSFVFQEIFDGLYTIQATGELSRQATFYGNGSGSRSGFLPGSFTATYIFIATITSPQNVFFNNGVMGLLTAICNGMVTGVPEEVLTGTMAMGATIPGNLIFNLSGPVTLYPNGNLTFQFTGTFTSASGEVSGIVSDGNWSQENFSSYYPFISFEPNSLRNRCNQGKNAPSQIFKIWNSGPGTLNYTISTDAPWLSCNPTAGSSMGEQNSVTVDYSAANLSPGIYKAFINIEAADAANSPQQIPVTLQVGNSMSFLYLLILD